MDALIDGANFLHDDQDTCSKFSDKIDEWREANEEKVTAAQVLSAIKTLSKKLTKGKCPTYETEGFEQAKRLIFGELIEYFVSSLVDSEKLKVQDVQQAYYQLYLDWFKHGPAIVHLHIMADTFDNSDVDMESYLKGLTGEPRAKLLAAITSPIVKREDTKDEEFYNAHRQSISRFIDNAFQSSDFAEKDVMIIWLDYSYHLYLDYLHLEDEAVDTLRNEAGSRLDDIESELENFSDVKTFKSLIAKITAAVNKPGFPQGEEARRSVCEAFDKLASKLRNPGDAEKYSDDVFNLMEAVSHSKGNVEEALNVFGEVVEFFGRQERDIIKETTGFFKVVAPKFKALVEKLDIKFLEKTRFCCEIMNRLEDSYANNQSLAGEWLSLAVPLLKRPCYNCFREVRSVLSCDDAIRWKDHGNIAGQLIDCLCDITIPKEKGEDNEKCVKELADSVRSLLRGLKTGKLLKNYGEKMMYLAIRLLELRLHDESIFQIVEELGENLEINVKEKKNEVMGVMKRLHVVLKDETMPWEDSWPLQRAVDDLIKGIIEPVNDGRVFEDDDLKVFASMCDTCLSKEGINQKDATLSPHMIFVTGILEKLIPWMASTKRLGYIVKLIPSLLAKYEEDDEDLGILVGRFLNEIATGEAAAMSPHLEDLLKLYVDKGLVGILMPINTTYPTNPAPMTKYFQVMFGQLIDSGEPQLKSWMSQIFLTASKKQPELFTDQNIKDLIKLARNDAEMQSVLVLMIQEIAKRKPEKMSGHIDSIMDRKGWNPQMFNWLNDVLSAVALNDKTVSNKVLDFLIKSTKGCEEKHELLSGLYSIRLIGFKYPDVIKPKRQEIENLAITDVDAQGQLKSILDMIDGKTPDNLKKQLEEQQESITGLVGKVEEVEVAVLAVQDEVGKQGEKLNNVENEVTQQGQRLNQVEETVDETVAKVEEIDGKTLSHAPYWSRDLSKLMNPATDHDWRLLSSRLGYSNDDIRGWAQQSDPCMAMLNEWYATRKTSDATFAILDNLQEMNRMDAALIVENAMKKAEAVVEDEEFEYAAPPEIFISYQWGHQPEAKLLHRHLGMAGYDCWLDVGQMGGGDKLFDKIDTGMRAAKLVISCVTSKYAKSPNCNREVNLAVGVKKPIIPLLLENCPWPPPGSMGPIFSESLYIQFFQTDQDQTPDDRYWPEEKFQELLMQLSVNGLTPDEGKIEPIYRNWWMPLDEEIKIDKSKTRNGGKSNEATKQEDSSQMTESPEVFISYQWGKQKNIIQLYQRLSSLGFSCWLDIKQMGGGDSLYDKIDRGIRGSKIILSCVTKKYALSPNCRREVSLTDALKKPMVPLLLEEMTWPPRGPMSMIMTPLLYIGFQQESDQTTWNVPQFDELIKKINQHVSQPIALGKRPAQTNKDQERTNKPKASVSQPPKKENPKPIQSEKKKETVPKTENPKTVESGNQPERPQESVASEQNEAKEGKTSKSKPAPAASPENNQTPPPPKPTPSANSSQPTPAPNAEPTKSKSCVLL